MGAGAFHGRVRDGIGCRHPAIATRSSNTPARLTAKTGCQVLDFVCAEFAACHSEDDCCAGWAISSLSGD